MSTTQKKTTKKTTSYHHGDLRKGLLLSALALLDDVGVEKLSLRKVAAHAGVSHGAPYRHFEDKESLLAAVALDGFEKMRAMMVQKSMEAKFDNVMEELNMIGKTYLQFAVENPTHFRLMFGPYMSHFERHCKTREGGQQCFEILLDCVRRCQASGELPPVNTEELAVGFWSVVQGAANLHINGMLITVCEAAEDPVSSGELATKALNLFMSMH